MPSIQMKFVLVPGKPRNPHKGEWFLNKSGWPEHREFEGGYGPEAFILKLAHYKTKGFPKKVNKEESGKVFTKPVFFRNLIQHFEYTGEMRRPKKGEWFCAEADCPPQLCEEDFRHAKHRIVRVLNEKEIKNLVFTRAKQGGK